MDQRYNSGDEIHLGDRVSYNGQPGHIVFVIDRGEFSTEFPAHHWQSYATGFMIKFDNGALLKKDHADDHLEKIS